MIAKIVRFLNLPFKTKSTKKKHLSMSSFYPSDASQKNSDLSDVKNNESNKFHDRSQRENLSK